MSHKCECPHCLEWRTDLESELAKYMKVMRTVNGAIEDMINSGEILQEPLMQELMDEIHTLREESK